MKTIRSTIACAAALAVLALVSSCDIAPIGAARGDEGGTVTFVIPAFNPKVFGTRAGIASADTRAYIIASSAVVEIWDPSEIQSFGTFSFDPVDPAILDGTSTENQLTLVAGIVLGAGEYLAKVRVYNGLNDDPETTEVDEGAVPIVVGEKAFEVGYMLPSTVTVTCLPFDPTDLAEGSASAEVDLPNVLVFADDGPPLTMGSETWFRIFPTTGCTMISAANVNETTATPVPVLALFDPVGKLIRTAMPTGPGPTTLSFLSDNTKSYYLAAISGAKASDTLAPRADRHFGVSYAPRDLAANSAPAAVSAYTSPSDGEGLWINPDFGMSWGAATDPDGDSVTYRADISTNSDGDAWQYFEPGIFWSRTTEGGGSPGVHVGSLAVGTYYWCVTTLDGIGGETHGPVWSFTVQPQNNAPNQPTDLSPAGAAATGTLRPSFAWNGGDPNGDSVTYSVQISTSPSLNVDPILREVVDVTAYTLDADLSYETLYYWIVIATDEHGAYATSETASFVTPAQPTVYSQNFDAAADLASSGWVKGLNMTTGTVEVVADPTASGRGKVLRVYDANQGNYDPGATVYSPVINALESSRTAGTSKSPATLEYDFFLIGAARWFVLGKTQVEAFIMNDGGVRVYSYYNAPKYSYLTLSTGQWYHMKILINGTPGKVSYYVYDGSTLVGSTVDWAWMQEASYDADHLGGSSSGRLMFGSWFSSSSVPDNSYGEALFDDVWVYDTLR